MSCVCLLPAVIPFVIHIEGLFIISRIVGIRMHPCIYLSSHFSSSDRLLGSIMPNLWVCSQFNECNDSSYGGTVVAWSKTSKSVLSSAGRGVNNTAQHSLDPPLNINQGSRFLLPSSELPGCRKQTPEVFWVFLVESHVELRSWFDDDGAADAFRLQWRTGWPHPESLISTVTLPG